MTEDDVIKKIVRSEWSQIGIVLITIASLFFWNRTESRTDIRHMDTKLESSRNLILAIHDEMKDFHARLERQDAEFKAGLLLIEERMKK